jgi:hypothetical protein
MGIVDFNFGDDAEKMHEPVESMSSTFLSRSRRIKILPLRQI